MKTDIQIAQAAKMEPIENIAEKWKKYCKPAYFKIKWKSL